MPAQSAMTFIILLVALFFGLVNAEFEAGASEPRLVYFNTTTATLVGKTVTGLAVTGVIYSYLFYAAKVLNERFTPRSRYDRR